MESIVLRAVGEIPADITARYSSKRLIAVSNKIIVGCRGGGGGGGGGNPETHLARKLSSRIRFCNIVQWSEGWVRACFFST